MEGCWLCPPITYTISASGKDLSMASMTRHATCVIVAPDNCFKTYSESVNTQQRDATFSQCFCIVQIPSFISAQDMAVVETALHTPD